MDGGELGIGRTGKHSCLITVNNVSFRVGDDPIFSDGKGGQTCGELTISSILLTARSFKLWGRLERRMPRLGKIA
jgi:hypothetical protein